MDIFTKINLLSSIGLISSSIGIGTLNGTEKTSYSDEEICLSDSEIPLGLEGTLMSLREKVKEIENILQEDPGKKNLKGTINIDGITYEIYSEMNGDKITTTIVSYCQGQLLFERAIYEPNMDTLPIEIAINEEIEKALDEQRKMVIAVQRMAELYVKAFDERERVIDEQLTEFIIYSTINVLCTSELTSDMIEEAIINLDRFCKSDVLPRLSKQHLRSLIYGQVIQLIKQVKSEGSTPEQRDAAMRLLGILYKSIAIPAESHETIKRFYLKRGVVESRKLGTMEPDPSQA
jgi:hypothetical protein